MWWNKRVTNAAFRAISLAAQSRAVAEGWKAPYFAVCALVCDSLSRTEVVYSVLGGKTNAWHLREIVRRRCEQRQKISTSADEQQDHAAQ